jgi:uncharacterized protein (TIGR02246 family)
MQARKTFLAAFTMLCSVSAGCTKTGSSNSGDSTAAATPPVPADHSADERAIVAADSGWLRNLMAKNVDSLMMYYTSDAVSYGLGAPASGTDQIRALYTEMVKAKVSDPKMTPGAIRFSDDGTMAFDHGTYSLTVTPPGGKATTESGAYLNVWKKMNGQWKMMAEMSSPLPAAKK